MAPAAAQEAEDTAMAVPRMSTGRGADLPRPLEPAVAAELRRAFRDPTLPLASALDHPLSGHVQAARLLASAAKPGLNELRDWLSRFGEYPDAPAVHAALAARAPRGAELPAPPQLAVIALPPAGDDVEPPARLVTRSPALDRAVRDAARAGDADRALRLVAAARTLPDDYAALLRAEVAQALFSQGRDREALRVGEAANRLAHGAVGLAPWISGLAAWRLDRPELARIWFEAAWRAPLIAPGQRAGAAYWAARARLVTRGTRGPWLERAAREPRTFYGLLARRTLGLPVLASVPRDTLGEADVAAVLGTARGERAFGLLQVQQPQRAAAELRVLWAETRDRTGFGRSILLVARAAKLDELVQQMEAVLQPAAARLPGSRWQPRGGFQVDPALVYAIARLESNFDPSVVSRAGARGLMQLMPVTAQVMGAGGGAGLHDPATNLDLGQRYILRLSSIGVVGDDLIRMLASYNAGIGSLAKWTETMGRQDDPLLFMEALPGAETRAYVPRALVYSWLYAAQLGLPSASLDDLSIGLWPRVQVHTSWRQALTRLH